MIHHLRYFDPLVSTGTDPVIDIMLAVLAFGIGCALLAAIFYVRKLSAGR